MWSPVLSKCWQSPSNQIFPSPLSRFLMFSSLKEEKGLGLAYPCDSPKDKDFCKNLVAKVFRDRKPNEQAQLEADVLYLCGATQWFPTQVKKSSSLSNAAWDVECEDGGFQWKLRLQKIGIGIDSAATTLEKTLILFVTVTSPPTPIVFATP